MSALSVFVSERTTFLREYEAGRVFCHIRFPLVPTGYYKPSAYFLSQVLSDFLSLRLFPPMVVAFCFCLVSGCAGVCIDRLWHDRLAMGLHQVSHFCGFHHPHQCAPCVIRDSLATVHSQFVAAALCLAVSSVSHSYGQVLLCAIVANVIVGARPRCWP